MMEIKNQFFKHMVEMKYPSHVFVSSELEDKVLKEDIVKLIQE